MITSPPALGGSGLLCSPVSEDSHYQLSPKQGHQDPTREQEVCAGAMDVLRVTQCQREASQPVLGHGHMALKED